MIRLLWNCCLAFMLGLVLLTGVSAQAAGGPPTLVPRPVRLTAKPGRFTLSSATVITTDAASRALGAMLADYLFPATGFRLAVRSTTAAGAPGISIRLDSTLTALGAEGYRLEAGPAGVRSRRRGGRGAC